jgi:hypothetical protein
MAYLRPEKAKAIREELKRVFPSKEGWKFSVRNRDYTSLWVSIVEAPYRFSEKDYAQINEFYPHNYPNGKILERILGIMNGNFLPSGEQNFDKSDMMSDYFHVGWYIHLEQGKWDKPFVQRRGIKDKLNLL